MKFLEIESKVQVWEQMAVSSTLELKSLLTCSLCSNSLNDPRNLPCFHPFCLKCLEEYVEPKNQHSKGTNANGNCGAHVPEEKPDETNDSTEATLQHNCPTCNAPFTVGNGGIAELGCTQFLRTMLVSFNNELSTNCPCTSCEESEQATSHCSTCDLSMCPKCLATHESWPAFKKHSVVVFDDFNNDEGDFNVQKFHRNKKLIGLSKCSKHSNRKLKFFCETCEQLICRYCYDFEHAKQSHSCVLVEDAAKQRKEALKKSSETLKKKLTKVTEISESLSNVSERLEDNIEKTKAEISQHKQAILESFAQQLDKKIGSLHTKLNKEHKNCNDLMTKQMASVTSFTKQLEVAVGLSEELLESGSHEDILSSLDVIAEVKRLDEINQEQFESMEMASNNACLISYKRKAAVKDLNFASILDKNLGRVATASPLRVASSILQQEKDEYIGKMDDWFYGLCKWELCYRATRDGWSAKQFHKLCDSKIPTVILVKVGDYIFGGCSDKSWAGTSFKKSTSSFLFSLRNHDDIPPFRCLIYRQSSYAIFRSTNFGPTFGCDEFFSGTFNSNDLFICDEATSCYLSHSNLGGTYKPPEGYEFGEEKTRCLLAGSFHFRPTEIEVFH